METYGERLKEIRKDIDKNARQFALSLGVDPSQYYRTEKNAFKLPDKAHEELSSQYGVNLNWLISGVGTRFQSPKAEELTTSETVYKTSDGLSHQGVIHRTSTVFSGIAGKEDEVPYYDFDFIMGDGIGFSDGSAELAAYTMKIQGFPHCISFPTFGDSMERLIKSGSVVFARLVEWKDYVEYGQVYGIVMADNRRFLKYIRRSPENEKTHFLLRSENDRYDDFEVPKNLIQKVWLIEGWINRTH